jgi:competence protein ComFB
MRIHNLLEEVVIEKIDEIIRECGDKIAKEEMEIVGEYKLDVACYVLNRIDPVYIVSGRGLAYLDIDYIDKLQRDADLVTLIHQGIERVTTVQRPHYAARKGKKQQALKGFFFNFPIIKGRIFNSLNFAPVHGIDIELLHRHEHAAMIEETWQNPYHIVENTAGSYYFWPRPISAKKPGETAHYEFELLAQSSLFEEIRHFIPIDVKAEEGVVDYFRVNKIITIKDLYLVPRE